MIILNKLIQLAIKAAPYFFVGTTGGSIANGFQEHLKYEAIKEDYTESQIANKKTLQKINVQMQENETHVKEANEIIRQLCNALKDAKEGNLDEETKEDETSDHATTDQ